MPGKKVCLAVPGVLGEVLAKVLPEEELALAGAGEPPEVILLDLDQPPPTFTYPGRTAVLGLSFMSEPRAAIESRLITFDCPVMRFLKKPFTLKHLRCLIRHAPDGFGPVYTQPGINLCLRLQACLSSTAGTALSPVIVKKIERLYPELLTAVGGHIPSLMDSLPLYLVLSFYATLAHGHNSLEDQLMDLGNKASTCARKPKSAGLSQDFLDQARHYWENTAEVHKTLESQYIGFGALLPHTKSHTTCTTLNKFYALHEKLLQALRWLEEALTSIPSTSGSPAAKAQEVFGLVYEAGVALGCLLDLRKTLTGRR